MFPLLPVLLLFGAGGVVWYLVTRADGAQTLTTYPPPGQYPGMPMPPPGGEPAEGAPAQAPGADVPPPVPAGPSVAPDVTTSATPTEPQLRNLRVVAAPRQPDEPSYSNALSARAFSHDLKNQLGANTHGANYINMSLPLLNLVKTFQSLVGFVSDGLYGPQTAGAVAFYLGLGPDLKPTGGPVFVPPPFFWGKIDERALMQYAPIERKTAQPGVVRVPWYQKTT